MFFFKHFRQLFERTLLTHTYRHPEELDEMEEDEDETEPGPPPAMPQIPDRFRNGQ